MTVDAYDDITINFEGVEIPFDPWEWWEARRASPRNSGCAYFTPKDVWEIRCRYHDGVSARRLALDYHTSKRTIYRIANGDTYPLVPMPEDTRDKHGPKLTDDEVREIRDRFTDKRGQRVRLAGEYEVSPNTISDVVKNRSYTWVE